MNDLYRAGSNKHKDWRPGGGYGTICPRWTHDLPETAYSGDPLNHEWKLAAAQHLLNNSIFDANGRRYAAGRGIAFEAKPTNDGTWHGFPVPWEDIPLEIQEKLIQAKDVTRKEIRYQKRVDTSGLRWALASDED